MTLPDRGRIGWWVYVLALAGVMLFVGASFVGLLVLGVSGYYATRPICRRIGELVDSDRIAATLTVLAVLVPVFAVVLYAGLRLLDQVQQRFTEGVVSMVASRLVGLEAVPDVESLSLATLVENPPSPAALSDLVSGAGVEQGIRAANAVFGAGFLLALSVTLAYALLVYDDSLAETFATLAGGRETPAYAYARAVDADLESVFFGNLLFAALMSVVATVTYAATNLVAPAGLSVPMVVTLGFLTGAASLIPVVVGKVVYLPVVAVLAIQASESGASLLFVGGVLVVYVLVLDLLPQSVVQPYVSGRNLDTVILLFAYLLGPILFGWYGFFLLPIVFVLVLQTVRIVLPGLLRGERVDPEAHVAEEIGADPPEVREGASADNSGTGDGSGAVDG